MPAPVQATESGQLPPKESAKYIEPDPTGLSEIAQVEFAIVELSINKCLLLALL